MNNSYHLTKYIYIYIYIYISSLMYITHYNLYYEITDTRLSKTNILETE